MPEQRRHNAHWGWILAIAAVFIVALFFAMNMTNKKMQSDGQPPPEQLKERSGEAPQRQNP